MSSPCPDLPHQLHSHRHPFLLLLAKGLSMKNVGVYYSFSLALIVASVLLYRSFRSTIAKGT